MGPYVDSLKFAGGSFTLMTRRSLVELIELCHHHDVAVSTGGFIERVLTQGAGAVDGYIRECRDLGFDIIEISSGFITLPADDWLRLVERVQKAGLKAKPEVGIQFGAGGATPTEELEQEGTRDADWAIRLARRFLDAGAYLIMIESEGITENVKRWRTDVAARIVDALGLERVMFEAADPDVFCLVREELRTRGEPVRGPQPDRPARVLAGGNLGHGRPVGQSRHLQGMKGTTPQ